MAIAANPDWPPFGYRADFKGVKPLIKFDRVAAYIGVRGPISSSLSAVSRTRKGSMRTARFLAGVVGRAHARQMDVATRATWKADLSKNRSKTLDAPSWLWRGTVDLLVSHEGTYLEHCRKYAFDNP